jgi:hypothetical protein
MIPDFEHLQYNKPTDGKAFRVFVEKIGAGTQWRELEFKPEGWDECAGLRGLPDVLRPGHGQAGFASGVGAVLKAKAVRGRAI